MSDRVAFFEGRAVPRLALTGLALLWLAGCSSDVSRFDASGFSNPFGSKTADASSAAAAPAGKVASAPLAPPTGVASASPPPARPAASAAPVGGPASGWTAAGGSPVVVAQGETLESLSRKYGEPAQALLSANGLSSASEVKSGMRIVVPVYNAGGRAVASASKPKAESKPAKIAASEPEAKPKKTKDKEKDKEKAQKDRVKAADKSKPQEKRTETASKSDTQAIAKAEPAKPSTVKKQAIDAAPTGAVDPKAAQAKAPQTAQQADASGTSPEFRWPARGRIIEGFKAGGNDGINIAVPAGTSVRAAESGVVVYSGDGLKGYGNLVLIKHPNGFVSAYANNGELEVKRGEAVKRGQIIAKSGDTGNVNAPQLHFELRKGSTPVDPTQYLAGL